MTWHQGVDDDGMQNVGNQRSFIVREVLFTWSPHSFGYSTELGIERVGKMSHSTHGAPISFSQEPYR